MRRMQNLLKIAVVAAGGTTRVADRLGVDRATVSRYIAGLIPFPPERVGELCEQGGRIVAPARLAAFLADREAEKARAKVLARAA